MDVNPYKKINLTAAEKAELDIAHAALEKFLAINLFGVGGNIDAYFGLPLARERWVTAIITEEENLKSVIFCIEKQRLPVISVATTKVVFASRNKSMVHNLKCCLCNAILESVAFKNLRLGNLCLECRKQAGCKHWPEFNVLHNVLRPGNEFFVWEDGQIEHQKQKGRMGPAGKEGGTGNSPIDFYIHAGKVRFTLDDRNYRVLLSTPIHLEVYSSLHTNLEEDHHHVRFAKEDKAILITIMRWNEHRKGGASFLRRRAVPEHDGRNSFPKDIRLEDLVKVTKRLARDNGVRDSHTSATSFRKAHVTTSAILTRVEREADEEGMKAMVERGSGAK